MKCPLCKGTKQIYGHANTGPDSSKHRWEMQPCLTCKGTGEVDDDYHNRVAAGMQMRMERLARGESLYDAAIRMGISSSELSARETGRK